MLDTDPKSEINFFLFCCAPHSVRESSRLPVVLCFLTWVVAAFRLPLFFLQSLLLLFYVHGAIFSDIAFARHRHLRGWVVSRCA